MKISKFLPYPLTTLENYYETIKMGIKQNLVIINLNKNEN